MRFRIAAAALALAALASPAPAATSADYLRCFTAARWCRLDLADPITRKAAPIVFVSAAKSVYFRRTGITRVVLELACSGDRPLLFLETAVPSSYVGLRLRFRVEPSGRIAAADARAIEGGSRFFLPPGMLKDLAGGRRLVTEIALLDGSAAVAEFDITGIEAQAAGLSCASAARR